MQLGRNSPAKAAHIEVHVIDANEPGRSACMSTDECGAYLMHLTHNYNQLTDGVIFMQPDPRFALTWKIYPTF